MMCMNGRGLMLRTALSIIVLPTAMSASPYGGAVVETNLESGRTTTENQKSIPINGKRLYKCVFPDDAMVMIDLYYDHIVYRFSKGKHTELKLSSNGRDGKVHYGFIRGGGPGGSQVDLRFSNSGVNYIVFTAEAGGASGWPGHMNSGVIIMRGASTIAERRCRQSGKAQELIFDEIPQFVPKETDTTYLAWF